MNAKDKYTNEEATKILAESMKESYLSSLGMIQAFSFGNWKEADEALSMPKGKDISMTIGALLGHTRSIFEYASEHMGMAPKEVMRGYGYYFYSNVLTDLEEMFIISKECMDEIDNLEEMLGDGDDNDKSA